MSVNREEETLSPVMERAEDLVSRLEHNFQPFLGIVGVTLMRWLEMAREEAEDIWAEAEAMSRDKS